MSWTDYENSTYRSDNIAGGVQFSDSWNEGARYQQLRGGSGSNKELDAQFATLGGAGGADTGTVADDGQGWVLLKQDAGTTDAERVANYRAIAEKWQAAGYDVRVQDHNPEFGKKKQSEIAIRKASGSPKPAPAAPEPEKIITDSPKLAEAKERVQTWEANQWSGNYADDLYHDSADTTDWLNKYKLKLSSVKADPTNASSRIGQN